MLTHYNPSINVQSSENCFYLKTVIQRGFKLVLSWKNTVLTSNWWPLLLLLPLKVCVKKKRIIFINVKQIVFFYLTCCLTILHNECLPWHFVNSYTLSVNCTWHWPITGGRITSALLGQCKHGHVTGLF